MDNNLHKSRNDEADMPAWKEGFHVGLFFGGLYTCAMVLVVQWLNG